MPKQSSPLFAEWMKITSQVFGGLVFFVGFLALLGWQLDILIFKRILPSLPVIAPNTAFTFFVSGLILIFINYFCNSERKILGVFLSYVSIAIALVGFLTLFEYIFRLDLGIDRLLYDAAQGVITVRMSPQSAFNFLMVGISLALLVDPKDKERISASQIIVLLAGAVSLFSLFGFIYSIPDFYTIAPYKGMAAHTAVAFTLLFSGILLAYPDAGFMKIFISRNPSGIAARRLFFTLIVILFAEILVATGRKWGYLDFNLESLLHLFIVVAVFIYLIFFAFRSLDELGRIETVLAKTRELDQAKTEFVSLASHQLRTPLTAVSWYTEMLLGKDVGSLTEKQEYYLKEIYAGNQRMIDLVDDLLNSSRIEMGTLEAKPEKVQIIQIMDNSLNEFLPQINQKNLRIKKIYGSNIPELMLDPEFIKIVFQNLISNAIKYTSQNGKIEVEIKKQKDQIMIRISDNGWGVPKYQQGKIFTKLFRADNVRARDTEGTGLGLYIAKAIIKQSKGKLWFESAENKGTTFYITFKT